jgi:hypothetical protein
MSSVGLTCGFALGWKSAMPARSTRLLRQPLHRTPTRGKLGGDLDEQPLPSDQPIGQVRPHVGEARLDHLRGDTARTSTAL